MTFRVGRTGHNHVKISRFYNTLTKTLSLSHRSSDLPSFFKQWPRRSQEVKRCIFLDLRYWLISSTAVVLMGNEFVDRNEPIRLRCNATGPKIPDDIDWFKDGTKLDTRATKSQNIIITNYRSLEVGVAVVSRCNGCHWYRS